MSTNSVRDISCGKMHEFAIALDKAGFTAELVQEVISSKGNKLAKVMCAALIHRKDKFDLLADLGPIVVPDDYDHVSWLDRFEEKHQGGKKQSFRFYNGHITAANFANPSRVLKPGDRLCVRAYKQVVGGTTTSEERMAYLQAQGMTVYPSAQGASLVFEMKRDQLPKDMRYESFDEKERLPVVAGDHRVPFIGFNSGGNFDFDLGCFGSFWGVNAAFLGFRDEPLEA